MKNLPLIIQTEINGYQFYMFPYTIIRTFPEYENYLMENYMQCFGYVDDDFKHMAFGYEDGVSYNDMFYTSGPLELAFYSYEIGIQIDIRQYIIFSIENNAYISIMVDEYYVEGRPAYQKHHLLHDILIWGYDDKKFNYLAFDGSQSLSLLSFPQNQIVDAYKYGYSMFTNLPETLKSKWINERSIISMKLKNSQKKYDFNNERFIAKLELYLKGKFNELYSSFVITQEKCHIGIYNTNLIKYCMENPCNGIITYPSIHAWHESKRNLLNKLKYFYDKNNIKNIELVLNYEDNIVKKANLVRMAFLKNTMGKKSDENETLSELDDLFNSEKYILENIFHFVSKTSF